nr:hypothetical protein [Amylibacter sp.]
MAQADKNQNDQTLDLFFDAAKAADPVPKSDLMARVMADAASVQASFNAPPVAVSVAAPQPRRGLFAGFAEMIGGWAGASALTACVCVGLVYGFTAPDTVRSYLPEAAQQTAEVDYTYLDILDDTAAELEG